MNRSGSSNLTTPRHVRSWRLGLVLCGLVAMLAGSTGASPLERGSPVFRLPDTNEASESWDLVARLDTGHSVVARYSVTNEGPGERTAYVIGHLTLPDGRSYMFDKGEREGDWLLTDDGLFVGLGSSFLDHRGVVRRMRVDRGGIVIDLLFKPDKGSGLNAPVHRGGYWVDVLHTGAPAQGSVLAPGMQEPISVRGTIAETHTWSTESEPDINARRMELFSLDRRIAVYLQDIASPEGDRTRWLVVQKAGRELLRTDHFELASEGLGGPHGPNYPVPARLLISGPDVEGEIEIGPVIAQDDPMLLIPQPFRFLLSFKMSPRRVWNSAPFEFTFANPLEGAPRVLRGTGVFSVLFTNPTPDLR